MAVRITVTELYRSVRVTTTPYTHDIRLVGEMSNYRKYSSGHAYFTFEVFGRQRNPACSITAQIRTI